MPAGHQTSSPVVAGAVVLQDTNDDELPPRPNPRLCEDQELFFTNGDEWSCENLAMYRKHGYHPIILGEILPKPGTCESDRSKPPRYRVLQKLGFGAFATVWLARDLVECRYVALKVCCGTDKPEFSREANILNHIQQTGRFQAGFENVLTLYEAFIISGPNGFHECLVTEVVAPTEGIGFRGCLKEKVLRHVSSAVSLLHSHGIAHGDLHQDNFGVAAPGLQELSEEDITDYFRHEEEVIPVIPRDPTFPLETVPAYVSPAGNIGPLLTKHGLFPDPASAIIKLLDFGRAFSLNRPPRYLPGGAPVPIRPPEALVYDITDGKAGSVWSKEADIWALGCTIYPGILNNENGFQDFYRPLAKTLYIGGPPPKEWLDQLDRERLCSTMTSRIPGAPTFSSADHLMEWLSEETTKGWAERKKCHGDTLTSLVQRMVKTEPGDRVDIDGVLAHPFLRREM